MFVSPGYVHDGYIDSEKQVVCKETYVGDKTFSFNHKDYTEPNGKNRVQSEHLKKTTNSGDVGDSRGEVNVVSPDDGGDVELGKSDM